MVFLAYKECAYFWVALEGDSLQGICHPERSEVGYVILSAAKDLCARHARPFAALRACPERSEGVTACRGYVILSAAKDLVRPSRQTLRCTQSDSLQGICHPERSEGSRADFWGITSATDC